MPFFENSGKGRMRLLLAIIALVAVYSFWLAVQNQSPNVSANHGVLNLGAHDLQSKNVSLDGEWLFVWRHLYAPGSFPKNEAELMSLPGIWNGFDYKAESLPAHGYATYQLNIVFSPAQQNKALALHLPFIHSAYALYADDALVATAGQVDSTLNRFIPSVKTNLIPLKAQQDTLTLTLQVANFAYALGGVWQSPRLGTQEQMQSFYARQLAYDLFIFGGFFVMSLYHFALYFLRRKVTSTLYFGLICFFLAIKQLFSGEVFFYTLFPGVSYEVGLKLIHICIFASSLLLWLFLRELFTEEFPRWVSKVLAVITAGAILATLVFTSPVYSEIMLPYWVVGMATIGFVLRGVYLSVRHKKEGAMLILAGVTCFLITVLHDIAIDFKIIQNVYLVGAGFFLFIISQALLLAVKFTKSFQHVEDLTEDLMRTNRSFSRFVPNEYLSFLQKESVTQVQLSDQNQSDMTVFFSDIRSYTTLSERMSPRTNFRFINDYLGRVVHLIDRNNGVVNQYLGDGILALFMKGPQDAVQAAVQIQHKISQIKELGGYTLEGKLENGIGIHSGPVILGIMGTEQRMMASVISDTVNSASRLEGLTKYFGAQIIISQPSLLKLEDSSLFSFRFLGKIQVKGKSNSLKIYEILDGLNEVDRNLKLETKAEFENGLRSYLDKDFTMAVQLFHAVVRKNPRDVAAQIYAHNSEMNLKNQVAADWEGTLKMEIK